MSSNLTVRIAAICAFALLPLPAVASGAILKGQVETKEQLGGAQPKQKVAARKAPQEEDPFSGGNSKNEPPPADTEPESTASPPGLPPQNEWAGQPDAPSPGLGPSSPLQGNALTTGGAQPTNDPDQTPEMILAWDAWHHRVAESIFVRFNTIAKSAFIYSPPLRCRVQYQVSNTGKIGNVQILEKSPNVMFNLLIMTVLKSVNGDMDLLRFPEGSRRTLVSKEGVFLQNCGRQGFRYTIGDSESVTAQ
jgi:hypothetical protein